MTLKEKNTETETIKQEQLLENKIDSELKNEVDSIDYMIEKSPKTGDFTFALKKEGQKKYILSKYKPREHALKQLGEDLGNKSTIWILVGFGFGYIAEELIHKAGTDITILILEPNQKLLAEQKKLGVVENWPNNIYIIDTLNLVEMSQQIEAMIPRAEVNNIHICYLEHYREYYKLYCNKIEEMIKDIKIDIEINMATVHKFNKQILRNVLYNARYINENNDIMHLQDNYKDIPALIVCAGPSLEKNIEEIKNFKGIILAIGRTMTPLLKRGIRPDFVVSLDPQDDVVYETFGEYKEHDIPLITLTGGSAKVISSSKGEKYLLENHLIITKLFKTYVNPILDCYSTVTTLALSFAEFMGCSPVVYVGQDLAFTGEKSHADETNIALDKEFDAKPKEMLSIKGYHNMPVLSNENFASVIRWIQAHITQYPDIIHINATEGGAYIEGMLHIPLKEVIDTYCTKDKPEITHVKLINNQAIDYKKRMQQIKNSLSKLRQLLKTSLLYYELWIQENKNGIKKNHAKSVQLIQNIKKINHSIQKIPNALTLMDILNDYIDIIIDPLEVNKHSLEETEEEELIHSISINRDKQILLFSECNKMIEIIDEILKED